MANEELIKAAAPAPGGSPSWSDLLPLLLEVLADGPTERAEAMLRRMARAADAWNDYINGDA